MFRNSGEMFLLVLPGSQTIWVECKKEHFLEEGREGVYFPEERVRGDDSRHL